MDTRAMKIINDTASDFTYLLYKVRELEAFIDSERRFLVDEDRLLEAMYTLDRISDKLNDHLGVMQERTIN
ncbi:MAG: hypothetical protein ACO2ZP_10520 [Bacteriovoracaceae bacterium]